jgi:hypothetical protein
MRRLLSVVAVGSLMAVPVSLVVGSGPAWASTSISCTKISGKISGNIKITGSKCKPKIPKGYGNASVSALALGSLDTPANITWTNSDFLTVEVTATSSPGQGICPKGYTEEDSTIQVTGSSSDAFDTALASGSPSYNSQICLNNKKQTIKLPKHGSFEL